MKDRKNKKKVKEIGGKDMQKRKIVIVFILCLLIPSIAFSQVFRPPKPHSTDLSSKTNEEIAGGQFTIYQYHSSLTQSKILEFYQDKLSRKGWNKMDLAMPEITNKVFQSRIYNFVKGDEMLVLNFSPIKAQGRIFYSISVGGSSKPKVVEAGEKFPTETFKEPKALEHIPTYPGSKQADYRKTPSGIQAGYMASGGVEAAKEFYLQSMPQRGWSFVGEKRIGGYQYDLSNIEDDCSTCPKLPLGAKKILSDMNMQGVFLEFRQDSKSCIVNITEISGLGDDEGLTSLGLGDTMITVLYNDKK